MVILLLMCYQIYQFTEITTKRFIQCLAIAMAPEFIPPDLPPGHCT